MNAVIPPVAFMFALFSVLLHLAGLGGYVILPLAVTAFLALVGMAFAPAEHPVSGRVACLMALALAASPLAVPWAQGVRLRHLEKRRAEETAPFYKSLDEQIEAVRPGILAYHQQHGLWPDFHRDQQLGFVDRTGALRAAPPAAESLRPPRDPFMPGNTLMRWAAIRDTGVLIVSAGQDGVAELPLPGVMMDGPPAHPLASYAALGEDPRWRTYDPTNGAISIGDVVHFVGAAEYGEAMKPLFTAWDAAHGASPWRPSPPRRGTDPDPDPQSARDGTAAEALLARGEWMAALALASRAKSQRDIYEAQWKDVDFRADRTRGLALYNLGAFREAADALVEYVALRPNDAPAHFYLGAALVLGGNRDAGLVHLHAAAQITLTDPVKDTAHTVIQQILRNQPPSFPQPTGVGP